MRSSFWAVAVIVLAFAEAGSAANATMTPEVQTLVDAGHFDAAVTLVMRHEPDADKRKALLEVIARKREKAAAAAQLPPTPQVALAGLVKRARESRGVAAQLNEPVPVVIVHENRALALQMRGVMVDACVRAGLPCVSSSPEGASATTLIVRFTVEVPHKADLLPGGMHSYPVGIEVEQGSLTAGRAVRALGISEVVALQSSAERLTLEALAAWLEEVIRRNNAPPSRR